MKKLTKAALAVGILGGLALAGSLAWRPASSPQGVLEVNGRIEGDQAAVGAKVGGKVVRLAVREGDRLEVGALVAEFTALPVGLSGCILRFV